MCWDFWSRAGVRLPTKVSDFFDTCFVCTPGLARLIRVIARRRPFMLHAKRAAKRKRRNKAIPVLGAAGLLSLASGPFAQAAGPAANLPTRTIEPRHELILSEEEVFDVSLATFYVFDRENTALDSPGFQLVRGGCGGGGHGCGGGGHGCGGCGHGCGCRGCGGCHAFGGHGCGGFHGCRGCGGFRGCGGCGVWWGGGGCCLSWGACQFC
jgi:hypothetical protein